MTEEPDDRAIRRRTLLATGGALLTTGLAGCSITIESPFGGAEGGSTAEPTPITRTRTTATPTSTPTSTPTVTPTATTTSVVNESDQDSLDDPPAYDPPPCVLDGSCIGPVPVENLSTNPLLVEDLSPVLTDPVIDPSVLENVDLGGDDENGETATAQPTATTDDGAVEVTVTPDQRQTDERAVDGESKEENDGMVCTVQRKTATTGGADVFLLNPSMTSIFPGALLTADAIATGSFAPALTPVRLNGASKRSVRNPLEVSISLADIEGTNTETVQVPGVGSMRTARTDILRRVGSGAKPANMSYEKRRIYSKEQANIELGAHYNNAVVDVESNFSFSQTNETNKVMVKFQQKYYDMTISLPNPVANGVVSDTSYLRQNDVMVKNVSYGRLLVFSFESKYSHREMEAALDVAINAGAQSGGGSIDARNEQILKNTKIRINVIGGDAGSASRLISDYGESSVDEAIGRWIRAGATYDPATVPGVPVSYQTVYTSNYATANVYLTTTYNQRNCRPKSRRFRVDNFNIKVLTADDVIGSKNTEEMYGTIYIGARQFVEGGDPRGEKLVYHSRPDWDKDNNEFLRISEGRRRNLNLSRTIEFSTSEELDRKRSYIQVTMRPREHDGGDDEFEGQEEKARWYLTDTPTPPNSTETLGYFKHRFSDKGSEIQISYDITPLPPQ
jgi:hypothetical protein